MIDLEFEENVLKNVLRDFVEQAYANIEKIDAARARKGP
jgi:hypothetical protein